MTQKYLLTFSTSNLKLKFLGVIAICLFTLFAITSCGGAKDRKKELDITNAQVEGKYEMMRLRYLKENKKSLYTTLLMSNQLPEHLMNIQEVAMERVEQIVSEM